MPNDLVIMTRRRRAVCLRLKLGSHSSSRHMCGLEDNPAHMRLGWDLWKVSEIDCFRRFGKAGHNLIGVTAAYQYRLTQLSSYVRLSSGCSVL